MENKIIDPIEKLRSDDRAYSIELLNRAGSSAASLVSNDGFLDIMKVIFDITGFDTISNGSSDLELAKHNGKREVWAQAREVLFAFNPEALSLIEHHVQENRKKRGYN